MTDQRDSRKSRLIAWIVQWRETHGGSISPENHRRLLQTRSLHELEQIKRRILENTND